MQFYELLRGTFLFKKQQIRYKKMQSWLLFYSFISVKKISSIFITAS